MNDPLVVLLLVESEKIACSCIEERLSDHIMINDMCVGIGKEIFASFDDGGYLCLINSAIVWKLE